MFRTLALGLIAAASLGVAALAPTAASAGGGWGWHPHHHHWHGPAFGIGFVGYDSGSCYVTRRVATPYGWRWRTFNICD
ncbi:hypothetical protein [Rhodopseudomonas telluris]|uniref:Sulfur globule protein n=1 Tax=Rhodopseudomonas telluris TaxID=644215 RepID=A0ABV6ETR2_9BRAD